MLSDAEFMKMKQELHTKLVDLIARLREIETRRITWVDLAEQGFQFACHARDMFVNGSPQTKKEILLTLGGNCTLKDHELALTKHEWLAPLTNSVQSLEQQYLSVGTGDYCSAAKKKEAYDLLRPVMRE